MNFVRAHHKIHTTWNAIKPERTAHTTANNLQKHKSIGAGNKNARKIDFK